MGKTLSERLTEAFGEEITSWAADNELGTIMAAWRDPRGLYAVFMLFITCNRAHTEHLFAMHVGLCEDRFVTQWNSCVIWTWFKASSCHDRASVCMHYFVPVATHGQLPSNLLLGFQL
jgi:hypothetical protein